ncbi:MAG: PIN domain nuclease [Candidatus Scalindua sp.]|nr:PIN domain nuclease [Candidatus Scalindua sp.]MCR4345159.1 PIN domain nuclease [Candidatus Scalindua sp.]
MVDTSVWIDFFASRPLPHVNLLEKLIHNEEDICICGIVITEILQGIKNDREFNKTRKLLECLVFLPMSYSTFIKSAQHYRTLRKNGITIKRVMDCLIATVAIEHDVPILHNDKDFALIESQSKLKTYRVT